MPEDVKARVKLFASCPILAHRPVQNGLAQTVMIERLPDFTTGHKIVSISKCKPVQNDWMSGREGTWLPNTESPVLQPITRCTSLLNPRFKITKGNLLIEVALCFSVSFPRVVEMPTRINQFIATVDKYFCAAPALRRAFSVHFQLINIGRVNNDGVAVNL